MIREWDTCITSTANGGATSDRQICERASLPKLRTAGDAAIVDKGFNVQDLFEEGQEVVNIPALFQEKNMLSGQSVLSNRRITFERVHVERIIGLAKT